MARKIKSIAGLASKNLKSKGKNVVKNATKNATRPSSLVSSSGLERLRPQGRNISSKPRSISESPKNVAFDHTIKLNPTTNLDPLINTNTMASQALYRTSSAPEIKPIGPRIGLDPLAKPIGPRRSLTQDSPSPSPVRKKSKEWEKGDKIRKKNREIDAKIKKHVDAGAEAPKSTAFESMGQVGRKMLDNIRDTGFSDGDYLGSALTGALAMGAVSGTTEWANGGSFTGGFKDGLVNGALLGAGGKAIKVGAYGNKYAGKTLSDSFGRINRRYNVNQYQKKSKALKALETNAAASSKNIMNKK